MGTLLLKEITKTYPGVVALDDVSVEFREGEVHALCGENGAGKSTLIKVISGAIKPEKGKIIYNDIEYDYMSTDLSRHLGIEVIYQEIILAPDLSVAENIFLGTKIGKSGHIINRKEMNLRAQETLDHMHITSFKATDLVGDLKTANRQLVEIAKSVSMNAKVIIMDEPTAPLDNNEVEDLFRIIDELKRKHVTIIYVSHRMDEIFRISDRITVFRDGKMIQTLNTAETNKQEIIRLMVGRTLSEGYPERNIEIGDIVLSARNIVSQGVDGISFDLHRGEILGIGGLVGAGRTELVQSIFGAQKLISGQIWVNGKEVTIKSPEHAIKYGIGLCPEDRKLFGLMLERGVDENISICSLRNISSHLVINKKAEYTLQETYSKKLRIKVPKLNVAAKTLSGGNQQKVVLAKWMAANVDILILDEPTRGIDVGAKEEIYHLMNDLTEQGVSIIMVSSEMEELIGMSDRMIILHEGRYMKTLEKFEFSQDIIMHYASGLQ